MYWDTAQIFLRHYWAFSETLQMNGTFAKTFMSHCWALMRLYWESVEYHYNHMLPRILYVFLFHQGLALWSQFKSFSSVFIISCVQFKYKALTKANKWFRCTQQTNLNINSVCVLVSVDHAKNKLKFVFYKLFANSASRRVFQNHFEHSKMISNLQFYFISKSLNMTTIRLTFGLPKVDFRSKQNPK